MVRFDRIIASFNRRRWLFWGVFAVIFVTFSGTMLAFGAESIVSNTLCALKSVLW